MSRYCMFLCGHRIHFYDLCQQLRPRPPASAFIMRCSGLGMRDRFPEGRRAMATHPKGLRVFQGLASSGTVAEKHGCDMMRDAFAP